MIDSLPAIFDKHTNSFRKGRSVWEILEKVKDKKINLKKVTILGSGVFNIIENPFYKSWGHVTTDRSTYLKDSDCDGVAFYINDHEKKLIFIDLKSSLSSTNLKKSLTQNFFSFLKLQMAFAICRDYSIDDYDILFIMACPVCDEATKSNILDNISQYEMLGDNYYLNDCLKLFFLEEKDWSCKFSGLPFANENLHCDILNKEFTFKILTTQNTDDKELEYSF